MLQVLSPLEVVVTHVEDQRNKRQEELYCRLQTKPKHQTFHLGHAPSALAQLRNLGNVVLLYSGNKVCELGQL